MPALSCGSNTTEEELAMSQWDTTLITNLIALMRQDGCTVRQLDKGARPSLVLRAVPVFTPVGAQTLSKENHWD